MHKFGEYPLTFTKVITNIKSKQNTDGWTDGQWTDRWKDTQTSNIKP